jgi:hypothetical protein
VLGSDVVVVKPHGFLAGKGDYFPDSLSEAFLHAGSECSYSPAEVNAAKRRSTKDKVQRTKQGESGKGK